MKTFEQHRKKFQVLNAASIGNTKQFSVDTFFFPINSALYYQSLTLQETGITGNSSLLYNWDPTDDIFVHQVVEGYGSEGKPKERTLSGSFTTAYFKFNQRFTKVRKIERTITKPRNLFIFDFSLLPHKLYYNQNIRQFYSEFRNIATAYENNLRDFGSTRDNFISIFVPDDVPDKTDFTKVENEDPDNDELLIFNSPEDFWLRELWLLCSNKGLFSRLNNPERTNVLLIDNGKVISINIGLFKERAENETSAKNSLMTLLSTIEGNRTPIETEILPELEEGEATVEQKMAKEDSVIEPGLSALIEDLVESGGATPKETARIVKLAEKTRELKSPFGEGTIGEFIKRDKEEFVIDGSLKSTANKLVVTDEMRQSRTTNMTRDYITKSLEKDVVRSIVSLSNVGVFVTNIERTDILDAASDHYELNTSFVLANGKQGTRRLRIPRVKDSGTFLANNVSYTMSQLKVDAPIRKTAPDKVSLTSYYGKVFISRSDRAVDSRGLWLTKKMVSFSLDTADKRITKGKLGTNENPKTVKLPRDYVAIMGKFSSFNSGGYSFSFEYAKRNELFTEELVKKLAAKSLIPVAKNDDTFLVMGLDNILYQYDGKMGESVGNINTFMGGSWGREPIDQHVVGVYGKRVGLGLLLGRYNGLATLLKRTKIRYRKVEANIRSAEEPNEMTLKFKDFNLFVDRTDSVNSPLFASFVAMSKETSKYNLSEFNKKDVYNSIFLGNGLHMLAVREIKLMNEGFIDPKTLDLLKEMNEPTDFISLLHRAAYLLRDDRAPDETSPRFMKLRGYERVGGFLYSEFMDSVREQRSAPNPANATLSIKTNAVWAKMVGDATTQLTQVINPIHTLKEQESVSLSGSGGRSAQSLVARTRVFNREDIGIFSEAVPDSGKVGIKSYLSPDAAINSTLGMFGKYDPKSGAVGAFSTTSNIMPAANHDDKN